MIKHLLLIVVLLVVLGMGVLSCRTLPRITGEAPLLSKVLLLDKDGKEIKRDFLIGDMFYVTFAVRGELTYLYTVFYVVHEGNVLVSAEVTGSQAEIVRRDDGSMLVSFMMWIPEQVSVGKYTVMITVTDLKTRRMQMSEVTFTVVHILT